ncbi:MAG: HAD-IG family 5'-nucleotidase [Halobacteriovoraceae bacterium]|nr:HAD-IG family 5'-nucleotidase [Halobacteriovoraceae bacterium]
MSVYVNRTLNMKKIKVIGFDMDYTLVRYHSEEFEKKAYEFAVKKLIEKKNYPKELSEYVFNYRQVIPGLVIDKRHGNLLKLSLYGKVKMCYHGLERISFKQQQELYRSLVIDLNDPDMMSLDTLFSISDGVLYSNLIDLKTKGFNLPSFNKIADDVRECVDLVHRDGSLKGLVKKDIKKYIIQEPQLVDSLEAYKRHGKKLLVITNSEYDYCKVLLDFTINPFLTDHKHWSELFELVITKSSKPDFFTKNLQFLKIEPESGLMSNVDLHKLENGIYQGGSSIRLEEDLGLIGEEILYIGDHIYGDVVTIKKTSNWRTALVLDPLEEEVGCLTQAKVFLEKIDELMKVKSRHEKKLNDIYKIDKEKSDNNDYKKILSQIEEIDREIANNISLYNKIFNPYWGELMRAGQEESRMAGQVEKYACIYMAKVSDLMNCSPRTYFRPYKRILPHERMVLGK